MREPTEEQVTVNERRKYLKGRKRFFQEANRAEQSHLQALYAQTNPLRLREAIYQGLAALWEVCASAAEGAA